MMFKKFEPLEHAKHQNLRLSKISSFAFANGVSAVKISFSEFRQVSRFYPIVFFKDLPGMPQALLSLESGKNAFVDASGKWRAPYIPLYFRLYPFTLAKVSGTENKMALCIDPDAEHFKSGMGEPLFQADGKPVEFIEKKVLASLKVYQNELEQTRALFTILNEKGIIVDRTFKYKVKQKERNINGFQGVEMEKLLGLDDKTIADMVKNGTMGMVYEHIHSVNNFLNFAAAPGLSSGK